MQPSRAKVGCQHPLLASGYAFIQYMNKCIDCAPWQVLQIVNHQKICISWDRELPGFTGEP
jgi:hypothetical protein